MGKMKVSHCMELPPEGTIGEGLPEHFPVASIFFNFKSSLGDFDAHSASLRDHCFIQ